MQLNLTINMDDEVFKNDTKNKELIRAFKIIIGVLKIGLGKGSFVGIYDSKNNHLGQWSIK